MSVGAAAGSQPPALGEGGGGGSSGIWGSAAGMLFPISPLPLHCSSTNPRIPGESTQGHRSRSPLSARQRRPRKEERWGTWVAVGAATRSWPPALGEEGRGRRILAAGNLVGCRGGAWGAGTVGTPLRATVAPRRGRWAASASAAQSARCAPLSPGLNAGLVNDLLLRPRPVPGDGQRRRPLSEGAGKHWRRLPSRRRRRARIAPAVGLRRRRRSPSCGLWETPSRDS
jgi:hypothetical protein